MTFVSSVKSKFASASLLVACLFLSMSASAELPAWASSIATDATEAVNDTAELFGPVIGVMIVALIIIRLAKRFGRQV